MTTSRSSCGRARRIAAALVATALAVGALVVLPAAAAVSAPGVGDPPDICVTGDPVCAQRPVPAYDIVKSVDPARGSTVEPGDVLTYTLTITSPGGGSAVVDETDDLSGIADDADVAVDTASVPAPLTATYAGDAIRLHGSLPAGTYTVTYTATVREDDAERGDDVLGSFVAEAGAIPPASCEPESPRCTENPIADFVSWKTSSPASGTALSPGDSVTYTLHVDNVGAVPATVDLEDDLSGTLDDATLTEAPAAGVGTLIADEVVDGRFSVMGDVPMGEEYTVVYTVTTDPVEGGGDAVLLNAVVDPGEAPPTECSPTDPARPDCILHPLDEIVMSKTVDPAESMSLVAGQTVTYTLTFDVRGSGTAEILATDYLDGIIDDATFGTIAAPPTGLTVTPDDPADPTSLLIEGTVPSPGTYTVSYTVTVDPDGARGDNVLGHVVASGDDENPPPCDPSADLCTENAIAELQVTKSVSPTDGSVVRAGQSLTYTVTFASVGTGEVAVDYTDWLTDVIDDGKVGTVTAAAPLAATPQDAAVDGDPESLHITGTLAGGQTRTVIYTVVVDDPVVGDGILGGFLTEGDAPPPTMCGSRDPLCTENPVSDLEVVKRVNPADGASPGDSVAYTLSFTARGGGAAAIDYIDILDDADFAAASLVEPLGLTVLPQDVVDGHPGSLLIQGTVLPGTTAVVSYTMTVQADAEAAGAERRERTAHNLVK